jgi:hypothetical protein
VRLKVLVSIRLSCVDLSGLFRRGTHLQGLVYLLSRLSCLGCRLVLVFVMHDILSFLPAPAVPIPPLPLAAQLIVRWVCHDLLGVQLDLHLPPLWRPPAPPTAPIRLVII